MLSGKDLGRAIEQAINKKIASGSVKSKAEVARHFKVQPPSIYDWIKKGSISKDKLPELFKLKLLVVLVRLLEYILLVSANIL